MRQIFVFILGMIAGAILLYWASDVYNVADFPLKLKQWHQDTTTVSKAEPTVEPVEDESVNTDPSVQYVEVKGKNGVVTLHTGMSKATVQKLLGKPDKIDLYNVGDTYYEKWGYILDKTSYSSSDLDIRFENGKLTGVQKY